MLYGGAGNNALAIVPSKPPEVLQKEQEERVKEVGRTAGAPGVLCMGSRAGMCAQRRDRNMQGLWAVQAALVRACLCKVSCVFQCFIGLNKPQQGMLQLPLGAGASVGRQAQDDQRDDPHTRVQHI